MPRLDHVRCWFQFSANDWRVFTMRAGAVGDYLRTDVAGFSSNMTYTLPCYPIHLVHLLRSDVYLYCRWWQAMLEYQMTGEGHPVMNYTFTPNGLYQDHSGMDGKQSSHKILHTVLIVVGMNTLVQG